MKTSESIKQIAPALLKAQKSIKYASKNAKNPHFESSFANLESVINAIKSSLNEHGIFFIQSFSPSAERTLSLTTRLIHESGEWIEDQLTMPLQKNDAQGYGSAATYSRRFALAAMAGLYQADDDGNEAVEPQPVDLMQLIAALDKAKNSAELKDAFAVAWKASNKDASIKQHYDKLKLNFEKAAA